MATDKERGWGVIALLVIGSFAVLAFGDALESIMGDWPIFLQALVLIPLGLGIWILFVWLASLIDRE